MIEFNESKFENVLKTFREEIALAGLQSDNLCMVDNEKDAVAAMVLDELLELMKCTPKEFINQVISAIARRVAHIKLAEAYTVVHPGEPVPAFIRGTK